MTIYIPRKIVDLQPESAPLFFLAGPVRGGNDWQADMARIIHNNSAEAHIAIPCRWESNHPLFPEFHEGRAFSTVSLEEAGNRQTVWERHYMDRAGFISKHPGVIIFWLGLESEINPHPGPDPYAMDTRREIGKWTARRQTYHSRIVVGGDPGFYGQDVILNELTDADKHHRGKEFHFYTDMNKLVSAAFEEADRVA